MVEYFQNDVYDEINISLFLSNYEVEYFMCWELGVCGLVLTLLTKNR